MINETEIENRVKNIHESLTEMLEYPFVFTYHKQVLTDISYLKANASFNDVKKLLSTYKNFKTVEGFEDFEAFEDFEDFEDLEMTVNEIFNLQFKKIIDWMISKRDRIERGKMRKVDKVKAYKELIEQVYYYSQYAVSKVWPLTTLLCKEINKDIVEVKYNKH